MRTISRAVKSADGCYLYAEAAGDMDKPAILFIHGISGCGAWWDRQFDALSERFYCVRFDLRGHGASDKPTDAAAYRESRRWADDVAAVMSAFSLRQPTVCGWSYGGVVLGDYLRHYGQANLSSMVIVDTSLQINAGQAAELFHEECWGPMPDLLSSDAAASRKAAEDLFGFLTRYPLDRRERAVLLGSAFLVAPQTWQFMFDRTIDNIDIFQAVSRPTLVVYGQQDAICTQMAAEQFVKVLSHAQLSAYPCGHSPFYECADRFNLELDQFLHTSSQGIFAQS